MGRRLPSGLGELALQEFSKILLNLNYDPAYLALNQVNATYTLNPYKSQSRQTTGSSSPGREFFGGVQYSF